MGQSYLYIKCKHHKCEGRTTHCCVKHNQHASMLLLGSLGPHLPGKFFKSESILSYNYVIVAASAHTY